MRLKTLNYRFWLITVVAVFFVTVTLKLGFWQLSRAQEKLALEVLIQSQAVLPVLKASDLTSAPFMSVMHRTVSLTGHWLPQYTLYLDNRQMQSKTGFFVVTPFEFVTNGTPSKQIILVQRGWLARNFTDRSILPDITSETSEITITARIAPPPSKLFEFKGAGNGVIRQNIDIDALSKEFKISLLPYSLLQLDDTVIDTSQEYRKNQLLRSWPITNYGAQKNYGYMVQWWALSALISLLYVWFQLISPNIKSTDTSKKINTHTTDSTSNE